MGWFILLVIVIAAVVLYVYRVPVLAKLLGQSQDRVRAMLSRRKS